MKKQNKWTVALITLTTMFALLASPVWADPKFTVEDGADNPVFTVDNNGTTVFTGADGNNTFEYKVIGHTGGTVHTQTTTGLADSRLTVMSAEVDDYAPRLQMVGPQDVVPSVQGFMVFDYGSANYSLPASQFVLRHMGGGGKDDFKEMIRATGRTAVSFPNGNVGIGVIAPTHMIQLAGGAYSDGATWTSASSRELKKDIREVSAEEAIQTVDNLKPVSFVYKEGNQDTHVGFIAEDVPEMVATPDRKGLESMDIAAVLTKVVQEQQKMLKEQQQGMQELQDQVIALQNALQLKQDKDDNVAMQKTVR